MTTIKSGKEAFLAAVCWTSGMGAVLDVRGYALSHTLCEEGAGGLPLLDTAEHPTGVLVIFEVDNIRHDKEGNVDLGQGRWRDLTAEEWVMAREGDLTSILERICPEKAREAPAGPSLGVFPNLLKEPSTEVEIESVDFNPFLN